MLLLKNHGISEKTQNWPKIGQVKNRNKDRHYFAPDKQKKPETTACLCKVSTLGLDPGTNPKSTQKKNRLKTFWPQSDMR